MPLDQSAVVCLNGHLVNALAEAHPDRNTKFCSRCGEPTISACEHCQASILGGWIGGRVVFSSQFWKRPAYCPGCGKPYPWTKRNLRAAKGLVRDDEELTEGERRELEEAIPDLVKETPAAAVAAGRFKKLVKKMGKQAGEALQKLIIEVASETAKKMILPE